MRIEIHGLNVNQIIKKLQYFSTFIQNDEIQGSVPPVPGVLRVGLLEFFQERRDDWHSTRPRNTDSAPAAAEGKREH
jgi:hypothetical protein